MAGAVLPLSRLPGCASVMVEGRYLFDAPSSLGMNLALMKVEPKFPFHIFISHSHQEHFDPQEVVSAQLQRQRGFGVSQVFLRFAEQLKLEMEVLSHTFDANVSRKMSLRPLRPTVVFKYCSLRLASDSEKKYSQ